MPTTALGRIIEWLGMTGTALARKADVDEPGIYNALKGGNLRLDRWEKVSNALEVPTYLLRASDLSPADLREELSRNALERSGISSDYRGLTTHPGAPITALGWRTLDELVSRVLALDAEGRFDRDRRPTQ
jgi:hypothetical protein